MKSRIARKSVVLPFEDDNPDDGGITEVVNKENVKQTNCTKVELVGNSSNSSNPTSDIFEVKVFDIDDNTGDDIDDGEDDIIRRLDI